MPWPKGKPRSQDTKDKLAAAGRSRKHSPETKAKMAASKLGKRHTEETKAKISAARMAQTPERRAEIARTFGRKGKKANAETLVRMRAAAMKRKSFVHLLKNTKRTTTEKAMAERLRKAGVGFREQVVIGNFMVDFLLDDGTVIETHGCYWHGCRACGFGYMDRSDKDREKREYLESLGHRVIEVWEHEMRD